MLRAQSTLSITKNTRGTPWCRVFGIAYRCVLGIDVDITDAGVIRHIAAIG